MLKHEIDKCIECCAQVWKQTKIHLHCHLISPSAHRTEYLRDTMEADMCIWDWEEKERMG